MVESYPLSWPDGWKRTEQQFRAPGKFKRDRQFVTIADSVKRLVEQLRLMGISRDDLIISTNVKPRLDGFPRSDEKQPSDPGAAVYWRDHHKSPMKCMATDRYTEVADNLAALAATLEAMRAIERHGGAEILERAFRGFAALPEKASQPWRETLGLNTDPVTIEAVEQRFRELVREHHPDVGGDRTKFEQIVQARDIARQEVGA